MANIAAESIASYTTGIVSSFKKSFNLRVPVFFQRGDYIVKTASTRRELLQVYKLRYEVFHREYKNAKFPFGFDRDKFDRNADHLVILDAKLGKVVGTYRLIFSSISQDFYSATEFEIDNFIAHAGTKVELSRACIHKDYRTGSVITLLWRGLSAYVKACGAQYLFGLASLKSVDEQLAVDFQSYFARAGLSSNQFDISVKDKLKVKNQSLLPVEKDLSADVPGLLKSYFKAGAKIYGAPAMDLDFQCTDFFTIIDLNAMSHQFDKKYQN